MFEIVLDHKYPFSQPKIMCLTRFTKYTDLYEGKDLYREIVGGQDWTVSKNLYELLLNLPDFIQDAKTMEDGLIEEGKAGFRDVLTYRFEA